MGVLVNGAWPMSQKPITPTRADIEAQQALMVMSRQNGNRILKQNLMYQMQPLIRKNCNRYSSTSTSSPNQNQSCKEVYGNPYGHHQANVQIQQGDLCFCGTMPGPCCRQTLLRQRQKELCSARSPPTCAPWIKMKKMKVLKKIQRKIGMSTSTKCGGISPNNLPPLRYSSVHGDNIQITGEGSVVARRMNSFCKAIAFSDRPVKINEKICMKLLEVSTNWSGVLRFGFTSHNPSTLKGSQLPRYACPDLTSKPGYWAKAFSDLYVRKDAIIFYYVTSAGDVHFGINGEEKGIFFSGVDTRKPLWGLVDVYGNTTAIEFVDPRAHLNNSPKSPNSLSYGSSCQFGIGPSQSQSQDLSDSFTGLSINCERPSQGQKHRTGYEDYRSHDEIQIYSSQNNQSVHYQVTPKTSKVQPQGPIHSKARPQYHAEGNIYTVLPKPPKIPLPRVPSTSRASYSPLAQAQVQVQVQVPSTSRSNLPNLGKNHCNQNVKILQTQSRFEPVQAVKQLLVKTEPSVFYSSNVYSSNESQDTYATLIQKAKLTEESNLNAIYSSTKRQNAPVKEIPNCNWSIECVACCDRPVDSVFYPCGHCCMCYSCSLEYWRTKGNDSCPICRANLTDVIKTYKS